MVIKTELDLSCKDIEILIHCCRNGANDEAYS